MFRLRHLGLIDVRGAANDISPADSCCNFFCEFLAVRSTPGVRSFGWVGEETAFHEHCRNICLSQHVETTAAHSAIGRRCATGDIGMYGCGELQAVAAVKISFYAARAAPLCCVEMNTYEDGVAIGVGDYNTRWQRNKNVAIPTHHYAIAASCQNISEALRHVECHILLRDPLARNPAAVVAPMSRIDHYSGERAAAFRRAAGPRCVGTAARQKCD